MVTTGIRKVTNLMKINPYIKCPELRDARILARLKDDYEYLSESYDVVGVFLFGSQNYNIDLPTSDFDAKAIVMPSVETLILASGEIHETHQRENGELTVFDIWSIHKSIKKQNVNFLEILFTKYYILNPKYANIWTEMKDLRETIAHMNEYAAIECLNGCANNKMNKVFKRLPSNADRIDRLGYDYKAWADVLRFREFMDRYVMGLPYAECLVPDEKYDKIMKTKSCDYIYAPQEIKEDFIHMKASLDFFIDTYRENHEPNIDYCCNEIIDRITLDCVKAYLNERCYKERWPVLSY